MVFGRAVATGLSDTVLGPIEGARGIALLCPLACISVRLGELVYGVITNVRSRDSSSLRWYSLCFIGTERTFAVEEEGAGVGRTLFFLYKSISTLDRGLASSLSLLTRGIFRLTPVKLVLLLSPEGTVKLYHLHK